MLNQVIRTSIGITMTQKRRKECGIEFSLGVEEAIGIPASRIRMGSAIAERRNQSVFEAASGRVRMIHHDPMASAAQAIKYAMING
jgi:hypothetical protein